MYMNMFEAGSELREILQICDQHRKDSSFISELFPKPSVKGCPDQDSVALNPNQSFTNRHLLMTSRQT